MNLKSAKASRQTMFGEPLDKLREIRHIRISPDARKVLEASGPSSGPPDLLNRGPVTPLKMNTPEPPSEATVPLSAAFTRKG